MTERKQHLISQLM